MIRRTILSDHEIVEQRYPGEVVDRLIRDLGPLAYNFRVPQLDCMGRWYVEYETPSEPSWVLA